MSTENDTPPAGFHLDAEALAPGQLDGITAHELVPEADAPDVPDADGGAHDDDDHVIDDGDDDESVPDDV